MKNEYEISDIGELTALYGNVSARALTKELDYISAEYKHVYPFWINDLSTGWLLDE